MTWTNNQLQLVAIGAALIGVVVIVSMTISPKIALMLGPGIAFAGLIVLRPFWGLILLTFLAQLDAITNIISDALPISGYKLLTALTFLGVVVHSYLRPRTERLGPDDLGLRFVVLLALWMLFSFFLSEHRAPGWEYFTGILSVILLFYLIMRETTTPERLEILVWSIMISGLISAILVVSDYGMGTRLVSTDAAAVTAQWQGQARSAGASDYNPTTAAHMVLVSTVLGILMLLEHPRFKALSGLTAAIGTIAVILTFARSAALAYGIVLIGLAYFYRRHKLFPLMLIIGLAGIASTLPFLPETYYERLATLTDPGRDPTLGERMAYNVVGLDLIIHHPITGVGPGNFPQHYIEPEFRYVPGRELEPRQLHNSYLELAAETGLVGLACFVVVIYAAARGAVRAAKSGEQRFGALGTAIGFALLCYLFASSFMPNEDTKYMWLLLGLGCVAGRLAMPRATPKLNLRKTPGGY